MSSHLIQNAFTVANKIQIFFTKPIFFLIIGLVVYFGFGLSQITKYSTADEHFWFPNYGTERIQEYWRSIGKGDWEDTQINDKPGVSLALISGIAIPFAHNAIEQQIPYDDGVVKRFDPEATKRINFLFRLPLLLFNGLFIFYFFWILKKILRDEWVALWACLFILLSPVILGISQIVNPDTLFWSFGAAATLTFYAYLQTRAWRFVWLATFFFGFTLLSKYVGIIFFPFFFAMIFINFLFSFGKIGEKPPRHLYATPPQEGNRSELFPSVEGCRVREAGWSPSHWVKKDLLAYFVTMFGGVALFALLMPAAIVDPKVLWESTAGFPGMLPIFIAILFLGLALSIDAFFVKSRVLYTAISFLTPKKEIFEKILYGILFLAIGFTLLNWMFRNSLVDLSGISFDEKTKASFTTDNAFLARFVAEWVPLTFALTPITLFLLLFAWAQGFFGALRKRALAFTLSAFFLVFYLAVIEQGLLVTVRYSIILFPFALILGSLSLASLFFPKTQKEKTFSRFVAPTFVFFFLLLFAFLFLHDSLSLQNTIFLENTIGNNRILFGLLLLALVAGFMFLLRKILPRISVPHLSPIFLTLILFVVNLSSLSFAFPHYFLYTNSLLPERYLLFHSWGYGGYEAAQYLNKKPNAENLTLWTDSYGVCEFFVGKCIKKQKVNVEKYPVDYILRTLRGQVSPKFPHHSEDKPEWEYAVGGREKNFIRIYKNSSE